MKKNILFGLEFAIHVMLLLFRSVLVILKSRKLSSLCMDVKVFGLNLSFFVFYPEVYNTLLDPN